MKYNVHIYAIVRVKVSDVEATSQLEAIDKAEKRTDLHAIFDPRRFILYPGIDCVEYADDINSYLVDEQGDDQFHGSQSYNADKEPGMPS